MGNGSPIVVPLGDWSTDGASILESVLKRPAFRGISEDDLRAVAAKPGVILLLDGWNELDSAARRRAAVQVARLQMELPEVGLLISTRKQALDVPVWHAHQPPAPQRNARPSPARCVAMRASALSIRPGARVACAKLSMSIPLYLAALLSLPVEDRFRLQRKKCCTASLLFTKRTLCASKHCASDMRPPTAIFGTPRGNSHVAGNTTITEAAARKSISETDDVLLAQGQITDKPQPNAVLEALVSYHVLTRGRDPAGYSFQHQQFQEWYASHFVERLMLASIGDAYRAKL